MDKENFIVERIEYLCRKKGMSRYALAMRSGLPQSSISTILNRKCVPGVLTLEKICKGFGITLAQFFSEKDEYVELAEEEKKFLEIWEQLDEQQKARVFGYMEGIVSEREERQ